MILYEFWGIFPEKEKNIVFFYKRIITDPNFCYESMQNKKIL